MSPILGSLEPVVIHEKPTVFRGNSQRIRGDYSGAQVVTDSGSSRFGEATLKRSVYCASSVGLTLLTASGNIVGSSAAQSVTATGTALVNPSTSSMALVLLRVSLSIDSGTLAAGGVYHGIGVGQTVATSLSGMSQGISTAAGGGAPAAAGWVFSKPTSTTYTGAALPVQLTPIAGFTAAAITTGVPARLVDEVDGGIVLFPGAEYRPLFAAVGTSVIYNIGYTWMEVPVVALG